MKIGDKEIKDLTAEELLLNFNSCLSAEAKRVKASEHVKFSKNNPKNIGNLPDINPAFLERKDALYAEIQKRKLEKWI